MKTLKRAAIGALSAALLGGFVVPLQAATYKIHWLLGHRNLDFFEEAALDFKKTVETGSNGEISVDIVMQAPDSPAENTAAQGPEIASKVSQGEAEMGHSFVDVLGGMDPRVLAFKVPFIFRDNAHVEGVIEGPIGSELLAGLNAHGMVGLSFTYSGGPSGVASTERQLRSPEDFKGLRVGVFGDRVDEGWLKSLGAVPVPLGSDTENVQSAVRAGALDAVVITWRNFERASLSGDFKFMNMMGSTYLVSVTYINQKFFESLPEKYRALITKASREAGRIERAKTIDLNASAKVEILGKGVRPIYLSEKNRSRFVEALKPAYASTLEPLIGKDLLTRIEKTSDAPERTTIPAGLSQR